MKYIELDRKDWIPQTYMEFSNDGEFIGYNVGMQTYTMKPENFYDVMQLCSERGISFKNIKITEYDVELIPCKNTEGIEGYYNPVTKAFKSAETLFKDMDDIESWEII